MFLAESTVGYKRRRPDDVVVNTMWAWMSALGVARQSGLVSPSYAVCRPIPENGLLPAYVDRLLRTPEYAAEYTRSSIVHPEAHKRALLVLGDEVTRRGKLLDPLNNFQQNPPLRS